MTRNFKVQKLQYVSEFISILEKILCSGVKERGNLGHSAKTAKARTDMCAQVL